MDVNLSRKAGAKGKAHHIAKLGRVKVSVYQRAAPDGSPCFMVANYSTGKRRFDSYAKEADAKEAAQRLARQLSEGDVISASMTREQSVEYANAAQKLLPIGVSLTDAVSRFVEAYQVASDVVAAAKFYAARHKRTTPKRVADVVAELLAIKATRGASARYLGDLRYRLGRFATAFVKNIGDVTTAEIQAWLDGQKLASQSYANTRRVVHLLFEFATARGHASDNPVEGVERIKIRNGEIEIFTPVEMSRLFAAAAPDFLPCLVLGAFCGLRSAEIERLTWSDIHFTEKCVVVGASKAKTAGRRIVLLADNAAEWLAPYAGRQGRVWPGEHDAYYEAQQATAAATEVPADAGRNRARKAPVKWKANALRHSYASYRFALTNDAGRVAGELGNSAAVVHRHYRELVKLDDAVKWFAIAPRQPANILPMAVTANA